MNYQYKSNSINHNFEIYWSNIKFNFGYLGISKNGSTNFKSHFGLNKINDLTNPKHEIIFSTLRNPTERFVSSLLETTLRAHPDDSDIPFRNVKVPSEVYGDILNFDISSGKLFLNSFINTINKYGFYDAHFEPQFHFLFNKQGELRYDFTIFPLINMDYEIKNLAKKHKVKTSSTIYHTRANRKNQKLFKFKFKTIENIEELDSKKFTNCHVLEKYHPICKLLKIQVDKKYLVANKDFLETRLSNYYKKTLLPLNDDNKFNEFIYLNYSQDIHLYQELIKRYISKPLKLSLLI